MYHNKCFTQYCLEASQRMLKRWRPFGYEQFLLEHSPWIRHTGHFVGELHYGVKVRSFYISEALRTISPTRMKRILDAGCGKGQTVFWLSRRFPEARIRGVDINAKLIENCEKIAAKLKLGNVDFNVADLVCFRDETLYDLIVCVDVLEQISSFKEALKNLVRSVKLGGLLLLHVPHKGKFQETSFGLRRFVRSGNHANNQREQALGASHIHDGLEEKDFEILKVLGVDYNVAYTFGPVAMWAHTLFEMYRGSRRYWHLLCTPLLGLIARAETTRRLKNGGELLIKAERRL